MAEQDLTMEELLTAYHALERERDGLKAAQTADKIVLGEYNGNPTVQILPHGKRPWTMGVGKFLTLVENADKWADLYIAASGK